MADGPMTWIQLNIDLPWLGWGQCSKHSHLSLEKVFLLCIKPDFSKWWRKAHKHTSPIYFLSDYFLNLSLCLWRIWCSTSSCPTWNDTLMITLSYTTSRRVLLINGCFSTCNEESIDGMKESWTPGDSLKSLTYNGLTRVAETLVTDTEDD